MLLKIIYEDQMDFWKVDNNLTSWVHLILSSNLSRKFKALLQDSFS